MPSHMDYARSTEKLGSRDASLLYLMYPTPYESHCKLARRLQRLTCPIRAAAKSGGLFKESAVSGALQQEGSAQSRP